MTMNDFVKTPKVAVDCFAYAKTVDPKQLGHVAVLCGGVGSERAVSLTSGQAVYEALLENHIHATLVDTAERAVEQLSSGGFDRAFNVLHGPIGEDGTILGLLTLLNIPYTGSGVLAAALAMDKVRTKLIWQALNLPTPPFGVAQTWAEAQALADVLSYPLVVKPIHEGSSVGVHVNLQDEAALKTAFNDVVTHYGGAALLEPFIAGDDYFVAIVGTQVLPSVRVQTQEEFYSYKAKYQVDTNQYIAPGTPNAKMEQICADICWRAYQAVGCEGWGRLDLRLDAQGQFWLLEVNTVPGMTAHSLVPTAAKALGIDFPSLVKAIICQTLASASLETPTR